MLNTSMCITYGTTAYLALWASLFYSTNLWCSSDNNMSDNEDLLGDDLGDQSLADYNLGNEEEEQLLADDYDTAPQNVPTSLGPHYEAEIPPEYQTHSIEYSQPIPYQPVVETECVVPNITVEVPNPQPEHPHCTYAPYEPVYEPERTVPPAIPAAPIESPQIVPSELNPPILNGDLAGRERFISERPPGAQRLPQIRDIPDSLDKVVVPRGRGRGGWVPRHRHRVLHRTNYNPRMQFQPPQMHIRTDLPPMRQDMRPKRPDMPPDMLPVGPEISPDRPIVPELMQFRPQFQPFQYRPNIDERATFSANVRPNYEPRRMFPYQRPYAPYPLPREMGPNPGMPQVTIRQALPIGVPDKPKEPEVRMLPVQLPPNLPPGGLAGKKVLINPHFKGNFQPPVEGPIKDIDDAAERFIAEQRNALARAASRKFTRRSPLRFIENTTIEIENELASRSVRRRSEDDDLLRRQEEFINANRAGLRRRMRSPSPARRSPSPRASPERRARADAPRHYDEESDYKRRLREQESLRERVLRAKEVRRRKNAVALHNKIQEREREPLEKEKELGKPEKPEEPKPEPVVDKPSSTEPEPKPDTTRKSPEKPDKPEKFDKPVKPEKIRERSPIRKEESAEVNSTCGAVSESLTPPREVALTPPLPDDDDDLDLILGDIDGILSDDDDSGRFKQKPIKPELTKTTTKPSVDLRSKLPPKSSSTSDAKKSQRQKIVFNDNEDRKKKEKSPPRKAIVSSTKNDDGDIADKKQMPQKSDTSAPKNRQRIVFDKEEKQKEDTEHKFANRRVILQRRVTQKEKIRAETDPTQPTLGIFSRAVRTAVRGTDEPRVELAEDDDELPAKGARLPTSAIAAVMNLPPGITDTRLKTLAGNDVQSLILDKEERSARITFKTPAAAENFKRKFNNKMVAASRLTVTLR
ncbi:hypothetical protein O3G_MSEX007312 [Manduca sexta]|uniref:Uncharacterized protein n=1 Tax=Manduca sexta TaxID=7130 RepID=A0A921Z5I3_MANSE|nr:hypothetical protein O3G_MSEX007312 [Manduca sexta]